MSLDVSAVIWPLLLVFFHFLFHFPFLYLTVIIIFILVLLDLALRLICWVVNALQDVSNWDSIELRIDVWPEIMSLISSSILDQPAPLKVILKIGLWIAVGRIVLNLLGATRVEMTFVVLGPILLTFWLHLRLE